ncbi:MAG: M23 family metallopeptidase [Leptospiraceae bacterium]|nr:M23 family metallopeptidase [Leptospiraceae bacterium]
MLKQIKYSFLFAIILISCISEQGGSRKNKSELLENFFQKNPNYISDGFDFPIGKPNATGYYNAQEFQSSKGHLGEDWNNATREDMGDPVFAASNGIVTYASYVSIGWGNVVIISHKLPEGIFVETLYGHLEKVRVYEGNFIHRGDNIGTIGDADGAYSPHLHFELRDDLTLSVGHGYGDSKGYLHPTRFIKANRKF